MTGPLQDISVVDLTRVLAGPYATMVLADLGATVIKVEPPGGDDARDFPPFVGERSAYFESLNRGKSAVTLDLGADGDRRRFEELLAGADVLVENYRPGTMDRLGYGWDAVHSRCPELIYASVSGFGHTGPYSERAAYDLIVQAMGGLMSLTGHTGTPPTRAGTSIGDIAAGLFATIGILAALHDRRTTGKGQHVDVAMLDSQIAILENAVARYTATGTVPEPLGSRHPSIAPFEAFEAVDGYLVVAAGNDDLFSKLCRALDRPELAAETRYATNGDRIANGDELRNLLATALGENTVDHWLARLTEHGVPCAPVNTMAEVLSDPQVMARNMIVSTELADGTVVKMSGNPIKLSAHHDPSVRPAAP